MHNMQPQAVKLSPKPLESFSLLSELVVGLCPQSSYCLHRAGAVCGCQQVCTCCCFGESGCAGL